MTGRFIQKNILSALKIVYGFVAKAVTWDGRVARELLFDDSSVSDEDLTRYMGHLRADSKVGLDLPSLARVLPSATSTDPDGRATWLKTEYPRDLRMLVLGATDDFIVDRQGVEETARYCGVEPVFLSVYHDAMLGAKSHLAAEAIRAWLSQG